PRWDDVAREAQLFSLDSTVLGSTLLDTASESTSACRGQSLFHTFSMTPGPALGTLSSPQCPVQTGSPGRASRTRTEASRAAPGARLARSGGAPRRCQEGRPFIPGAASRELPFGSARAAAGGGAALRRAALLPGPGRGRWMPRRHRTPLKGAAARQLAKQWRPCFPGPPPLGAEDGGRGRRYRSGGAAGLRLRRPGCLEVPRAEGSRRCGGQGREPAAGRPGRLMSCEKRADGVSEHTWSQRSSM
ncbi:hypothetical protein EI555_018961, partial [Monodon monoceros]